MEALNMKPHGGKGRLITFCGLDGCGKSTMIRQAEAYLVFLGYPVFLTKQPTDFVRRSDIFRTYMDAENHDAYDYRSLSLLAASDRVQHGNRVVLPALLAGETVVSDRYFYSCLANLRARGYEDDKWIYEVAQSIPKPDLAFFLDVPVPAAVGRVRSRAAEKDRYIDMELQSRLREEYIEIAKKNGGILLSTECSEAETFAKVKEKLDELFSMKASVSDRVKEILSTLTGCGDIRGENTLAEDLGLDSLGHVALMVELEERLGIEFEEADLNPFELVTVNDVLRLAESYMGGHDENGA